MGALGSGQGSGRASCWCPQSIRRAEAESRQTGRSLSPSERGHSCGLECSRPATPLPSLRPSSSPGPSAALGLGHLQPWAGESTPQGRQLYVSPARWFPTRLWVYAPCVRRRVEQMVVQ